MVFLIEFVKLFVLHIFILIWVLCWYTFHMPLQLESLPALAAGASLDTQIVGFLASWLLVGSDLRENIVNRSKKGRRERLGYFLTWILWDINSLAHPSIEIHSFI